MKVEDRHMYWIEIVRGVTLKVKDYNKMDAEIDEAQQLADLNETILENEDGMFD